MSVRQKYALNGECFFENARFHMERNDFPEIPIGRVGMRGGWFIKMRHKNGTYRPFIVTRQEVPRFEGRFYFNVLKNDGSSVFTVEKQGRMSIKEGLSGVEVEVGEWLKEENGYLRDGGILVEYGLQIEGFLLDDDTWTFNFYDPMFGSQQTIGFHEESKNGGLSYLYCHKQLLTFHSPYFDSHKETPMIELPGDRKITVELKARYIDYLEFFLEVCHGVLRTVKDPLIDAYLAFAQEYKLSNVTRLLDQTMHRDTSGKKMVLSSAIKTRHCLADWLEEQGSSRELAEELRDMGLKEIPGEAMKQFVRFFFTH
uniref:BTB domain-containing protein n=1 Tax=Caenorhabditis tropicalis TaxID=1561998 RepID=A0A1I7UKU7_9PELO